MSHCKACRPIEKEDFNNPEIHFGTCQECGRSYHVICQEYYDNISEKEKGVDLGCELNHYLASLRIKRRRQQLDDILLAIMLNKDNEEDIIEAVEKSSANSETKKELVEWLNNTGIYKKE